MRFLFCACAISTALDDWSGIDRDKAVAFIRSCITYEGGIALLPGGEVLYAVTLSYDMGEVLYVSVRELCSSILAYDRS